MPHNQADDTFAVQQLCFQLQNHLRALKKECDDFFLVLQQDRVNWSYEHSERYNALRSDMYRLYEEIKIIYEDIDVNKKYHASNQPILLVANALAYDTHALLKQLRAPIVTEVYDRQNDAKVKLQAIKVYQKKYQPESIVMPALRKIGLAVTTFCAVVAGFVVGALAGGVFGCVVGAWLGFGAAQKISLFQAPPAEQLQKKAKKCAMKAEKFFTPQKEFSQLTVQDSWEHSMLQLT